jgi:hypothetical protein
VRLSVAIKCVHIRTISPHLTIIGAASEITGGCTGFLGFSWSTINPAHG